MNILKLILKQFSFKFDLDASQTESPLQDLNS